MSSGGRRKIGRIVGSILGRQLSRCRDITPLIGESLDRDLTIRERITMRLHLVTCRACRNYLSNLKVMQEIFEEPLLSASAESVEGLTDDARARIRERIEESRGK